MTSDTGHITLSFCTKRDSCLRRFVYTASPCGQCLKTILKCICVTNTGVLITTLAVSVMLAPDLSNMFMADEMCLGRDCSKQGAVHACKANFRDPINEQLVDQIFRQDQKMRVPSLHNPAPPIVLRQPAVVRMPPTVSIFYWLFTVK
jgi:hypothetical protein